MEFALGEYLGIPVVILEREACMNEGSRLAGERRRFRPLEWWTCLFPDDENPKKGQPFTYNKGNVYRLWHQQVRVTHEAKEA